MDEIITEKNYPIRNIWLLKQIGFSGLIVLPIFFIFIFIFILSIVSGALPSSSFGVLIFLSFMFTFMLIFTLMLGILIINILRRSNFHYSIEEKFIVLHQGIISKENRNIPYGRIQGVFVSRGIFERIFGLASLTFEDFSQGGRSIMSLEGYVSNSKSRREILGFVGNKIHIPGLKKEDAEALKAIILQKVKENPIEDIQSGL